MVEAVELIEGLHRLGLMLLCPIEYFVQVTEGEQQLVSIPKLGSPVSYDNFEGCKNSYKDNIGEEISGQ